MARTSEKPEDALADPMVPEKIKDQIRAAMQQPDAKLLSVQFEIGDDGSIKLAPGAPFTWEITKVELKPEDAEVETDFMKQYRERFNKALDDMEAENRNKALAKNLMDRYNMGDSLKRILGEDDD